MNLSLCPLRSEADLTAICRWLCSLEHIMNCRMGMPCAQRRRSIRLELTPRVLPLAPAQAEAVGPGQGS